jgi:Adenosine deaminase
VTYPKIELHVHLKGTVRPEILLEIARRNDYARLHVVSIPGAGALCDDTTRERLRSIGESFDWRSLP